MVQTRPERLKRPNRQGRASGACEKCRKRKTRCVKTNTLSPCLRCQISGDECAVNPLVNSQAGLPYEGLEFIYLPVEAPRKIDTDSDTDKTSQNEDDELVALEPYNGFGLLQLSAEKEISSSYSQPSSDAGVCLDPRKLCFLPDTETAPSQSVSPRNEPVPYLTDLPSYIQKLPGNLSDDAVKTLLINGACIIPEPEIRDHLLHSYVNHAYWDMPLLDVNHLRMCVYTNTEDNQLSLLLFQAVMFAGVCSTDSLQASQLGFATMREVREVFYNRVKTLYEVGYERDSICVIQSLLLMTLWDGISADGTDAWHWVGDSLHCGRAIGLHCNAVQSDMHLRSQGLRRRLWWCMYIRDKLIALRTRRSIRIHDNTHTVPMPAESDFGMLASETPWKVTIDGSHSTQGKAQVEHLAQAFVLKAKLCVLLGRILESRYLLLSNNQGAPLGAYAMYYPDPISSTNSEFWQCNAELEYWQADFQSFLQAAPENIPPDVAYLNQGLLRLIFFSTVMALHRPLAGYPSKCSPSKSASEIYCSEKVENAACQIICTLKNLQGRTLASNINGTGAAALLPAMVFHLIRIKSLDPKECIDNHRHFETGKSILAEWQNRYPFADFCLFLVESATLKFDVFPAVFSNTPATGSRSKGGSVPSSAKKTQSIIEGSGPEKPCY